MRVANTAFGAASFLVLGAVGATMLVNSGFINTFWAILSTGLIIFLIGLPISHAAASCQPEAEAATQSRYNGNAAGADLQFAKLGNRLIGIEAIIRG